MQTTVPIWVSFLLAVMVQTTVPIWVSLLLALIGGGLGAGGASGAQLIAYSKQRKLRREEQRREEHRQAYKKYNRMVYRFLTYDWSLAAQDEAAFRTAYSELHTEILDAKVELDLIIAPSSVKQQARKLEQIMDSMLKKPDEAADRGVLPKDYKYEEKDTHEIRKLRQGFVDAAMDDVGLTGEKVALQGK